MVNSNIFVTGGNGYIGSELVRMGCSRLLSNVRDIVELDTEIMSTRPSHIIHLASKSGVDFCEDPSNRALVDGVNFTGSLNVFAIAEKHGIPVTFISSDHIFRGDFFGTYKETSRDFKPRNYYGLAKFAAESASMAFDNVKIVRSSTVIDSSRNIVSQYLHALHNGDEVDPPAFIWRSFIHRTHFCVALLEYVRKFEVMPKVLNIAGSKNISWWKLIYAYAKAAGLNTKKVKRRLHSVIDKHSAPRPLRAGLDTSLSKSLGIPQFDYMDAVREDFG